MPDGALEGPQQRTRGSRSVKEASLVIGHVEKASVDNGLLRLALRPQVNMCDSGVDLLAITGGNNPCPSAWTW